MSEGTINSGNWDWAGIRASETAQSAKDNRDRVTRLEDLLVAKGLITRVELTRSSEPPRMPPPPEPSTCTVPRRRWVGHVGNILPPLPPRTDGYLPPGEYL